MYLFFFFFSLKGKINAPPKDPDEQPIPKSLTRLFAFQEKDKQKVAWKARNCIKHDKGTNIYFCTISIYFVNVTYITEQVWIFNKLSYWNPFLL